ncbi:hypothetical protein DENSPDRAFT_234353 [Dentipellis sp. KUC8613]|nr:hypothetical protein DENSPDRAFT_234353 [Dentipellis sp. KUC8613]
MANSNDVDDIYTRLQTLLVLEIIPSPTSRPSAPPQNSRRPLSRRHRPAALAAASRAGYRRAHSSRPRATRRTSSAPRATSTGGSNTKDEEEADIDFERQFTDWLLGSSRAGPGACSGCICPVARLAQAAGASQDEDCWTGRGVFRAFARWAGLGALAPSVPARAYDRIPESQSPDDADNAQLVQDSAARLEDLGTAYAERILEQTSDDSHLACAGAADSARARHGRGHAERTGACRARRAGRADPVLEGLHHGEDGSGGGLRRRGYGRFRMRRRLIRRAPSGTLAHATEDQLGSPKRERRVDEREDARRERQREWKRRRRWDRAALALRPRGPARYEQHVLGRTSTITSG